MSDKIARNHANRIIIAIRVVESSFIDALQEAQNRVLIAQSSCRAYETRITEMEGELREYQKRDLMRLVENLDVEDPEVDLSLRTVSA